MSATVGFHRVSPVRATHNPRHLALRNIEIYRNGALQFTRRTPFANFRYIRRDEFGLRSPLSPRRSPVRAPVKMIGTSGVPSQVRIMIVISRTVIMTNLNTLKRPWPQKRLSNQLMRARVPRSAALPKNVHVVAVRAPIRLHNPSDFSPSPRFPRPANLAEFANLVIRETRNTAPLHATTPMLVSAALLLSAFYLRQET
jgi:hypothetical protein